MKPTTQFTRTMTAPGCFATPRATETRIRVAMRAAVRSLSSRQSEFSRLEIEVEVQRSSSGLFQFTEGTIADTICEMRDHEEIELVMPRTTPAMYRKGRRL